MICIVAVSNKNGISVIIPVVPGKINLPQKIRLDIYFTKIIKCWLNAEFMIFDSFEKRGRKYAEAVNPLIDSGIIVRSIALK